MAMPVPALNQRIPMTNFATRLWLSRILLGAAGITSLCLSLYELFISTILDYGHLTNWSAGTCFVAPISAVPGEP